MKFGQQLEEYIQEASAFGAPLFINYNQLKQQIRKRRQNHRLTDIMETAAFKRALRKAIATVNCFYVRMEAELLSLGADRTSNPQLLAQVTDLLQVCPLQLMTVWVRAHAHAHPPHPPGAGVALPAPARSTRSSTTWPSSSYSRSTISTAGPRSTPSSSASSARSRL
jgi:hypothetical protein